MLQFPLFLNSQVAVSIYDVDIIRYFVSQFPEFSAIVPSVGIRWNFKSDVSNGMYRASVEALSNCSSQQLEFLH